MLLPLAKVLPPCRGARFWGDTHRREPAVAFLFEFVAALQGLPLLEIYSAAGCHLSNYSSVNAVAVRA